MPGRSCPSAVVETVQLLRLYVASYAPLAIILAVQHSEELWPPSDALPFWTFAILGVVGIADAYRLPRGALRKGHMRVTLSEMTDESGQVAGYVATYLLPFVGLEFLDWRDGAALVIYFAVLFIVFMRTGLALINPALYVMGWRVVSGIRDDRRVLMLLPANAGVPSGDIYAVTFGRFLVFDHEV